MVHASLPAALLALAAPVAAALPDPDRAGPLDGVLLAQLTIHERIIIRVPKMPVPAAAPAASRIAPATPIEWKEHKGPKCLKPARMAGAIISGPRSVDVVMAGGERFRAKLDGDCRPLDFYSGFYVRPAADGMICADRDPIRVRSGATCEIDSFKVLKPRK